MRSHDGIATTLLKESAMIFRRVISLSACVVVAALFSPASSVAAQDVRYNAVTDVEFGGALGTLMNFVPGGDQSLHETVYIKGPLVRTDTDEESTIVDYASGTITVELHEAKLFYTITFEQALHAAVFLADAARDGREGTVEAEEDLEEMDFEFSLSTDGSGKRDQVMGYDSRQTLMTLEVEGEMTRTDDETTPVGNLAMITDTWMSQDFPAHAAMERAFAEHGEEIRAQLEDFGSSAAGLEAAFVHDPRLQAAVERNRDELEQLDGVPVKQTSYFVILPEGAELDRDAVLATEGQPISEGMGSILGRSAANAAADGARGAIRGRLGGLFGGGDDKEDEADEPDPEPSLIARMTYRVVDAQETSLDASLFEVRADYAEDMPQFYRDVIDDLERRNSGS